ncbi:wsc3p [Diplodia corticola]|uniref:Wsc3p n=1 Tax=Diplodia corticola TaxID=236234 RepID=A0A1J9RMA8_9PEZI|nr:wsc3p [Diplodia corticola]OJD29052.1 wsc3p [Diplodia corticola]
MAEPPSTITTVNGRRCTRVRRTSTLLAGNTQTLTSPATSTAAAPGTQTTAAPATTVPPLSSTEAASPVPAPAAPSSSAPTQPDASQSLSSEPLTSGSAQTSSVSAGPSQPSSSSSPRFAVATTATGPVAFTSDASSSLASSTTLNALPSSTIPVTTTAQSGSSDTLTAVVSVVSSSTFIASQPTSDSVSSSIAGGSKGSGSTSDDGHSSSHHTHHGLSPGAIAGIVLGVVFGIVAIVALILFCLKRRKERRGELNEKSVGEGGLAGAQAAPRSGLAAKWAALTAGLAATAGLKPSGTDGVSRRTPESPAFEPVARYSYSSAGSAGSTRHLRSTSAPASPPANRLAAFKQRFQKPRNIVAERRGRAVSTDSIPSFYSPTPPVLEDLPESLNPFRDPVPLSYHVTNPDAETLSPRIQTPKTLMLGGNPNEQQGLLTPGLANWRQPTPQFGFPTNGGPENPFLDPRQRTSAARRSSLPYPPLARVAAHARTQSGSAKALSQARSSWYSEDSGYVSPNHPSAHVPPLRPPRSNPFVDNHAVELSVDAPSEKDSASIYILPSSRGNSVDSGRSPHGPIPLPSSRTSLYRSSWLSPAISSNPSGRNSGASGDYSRRRTAASRETRGKSDPFDLDRPEVLAITSNYDLGKTPDLSRHSNGSEWWKEIIDEGTGSGSDFDHPSNRAYPYGLAP